MAKDDLYWTVTRYRGRPGIVEVEPVSRKPRGRQHFGWRWRFAGCSRRWRWSPSKLDALVAAANVCGFSGARADWTPDRESIVARTG